MSRLLLLITLLLQLTPPQIQWKSEVRHAIRMAHANAWMEETKAAYPCTIRYEDIVLCPLPMAMSEEQ